MSAPSSFVLDLGNGIALALVAIPSGTFQMGSPPGEQDRDGAEPIHEVEISRAFHMGRFPVTQAQYEQVVGANPAEFRGPDLPAEHISFDQAHEFCRKAGETTGRKLRLPTEAEWEYACRAGTRTRFYTGDDESDLARAGWFAENSSGRLQPAGLLEPNAWGLHDMHGGIYEWCLDWYDKGFYGRSPRENPRNDAAGPVRVLRGGSWFAFGFCCRSAARPGLYPVTRGRGNGFRVVVE